MIHGEGKIKRRRAIAACPDVKALRDRLGAYLGLPVPREYLASVLGCSKHAVKDWEEGVRPLSVFAVRLAALDARLSEKTRSVLEELSSP